jgi:hypothetical protein
MGAAPVPITEIFPPRIACEIKHTLIINIASAYTKRDWLICCYVDLNKWNIVRRATSEELLPAPTGYTCT